MIELLDSASRKRLLEPMPDGERFVLRREPEFKYPDDSYVLSLFVKRRNKHGEYEDMQPVRRGDYAWALRTARLLHIPDSHIDHCEYEFDGDGGGDEGYEGWHLNAHILRGA